MLEKIRGQRDAPASAEGRLRAVEWALECGQRVSDAELLEAARTAVTRFRNESARLIAARVHDPVLVPHAQAVHARALFNQGYYAEAASVLDGCWLQLAGSSEAAHVLMLRALSHQALGKPMEALAAESRELLDQANPSVPAPPSADNASDRTPESPSDLPAPRS